MVNRYEYTSAEAGCLHDHVKPFSSPNRLICEYKAGAQGFGTPNRLPFTVGLHPAMAAVDPLPRSSQGRGDSPNDEKLNEKANSSSVEVAGAFKGEVFDDIRDIDLGEDGKERPIGKLLPCFGSLV